MHQNILSALLGSLLICTSFTAHATEVPSKDAKGLKEPAGVARYTGSVLFALDTVDYDEIKAPVSPAAYTGVSSHVAAPKNVEASGQRWRLHYKLPDGRSPLEVVRNYQQQFKDKGYTALYDCAGDGCGDRTGEYDGGSSDSFVNLIYPRSDYAKLEEGSPITCTGGPFIADLRYAVLKNEKSGELVALMTHRAGDVSNRCPAEEWKKHLYATVVYVKPKAMEAKMETIDASVMSKAMSETGRIALYGILFDTASATIKSESKSSLDEIGKLLKSGPKLTLHIVGHTDGQGALAANFDLSKRRAEAVKAALVKDYGIAAARVTANGVASLAPVAPNTSEEGRAKNRRVELVPF